MTMPSEVVEAELRKILDYQEIPEEDKHEDGNIVRFNIILIDDPSNYLTPD